MSGYARLRIAAMLLFFAVTARAATFVVPNDDEMVRRSTDVITGRAITSWSEQTPDGGIRTITQVEVQGALKGVLPAGHNIYVSSIGGVVGTRALVVPGAPRFIDGEDVLLFLMIDKYGDFTPTEMTLGAFKKAQTDRGETVFLREAEAINGWDADGKAHIEKNRLAAPFVEFIRDIAAGREPRNPNYMAEGNARFPRVGSDAFSVSPNIAPHSNSSYALLVTFCVPDCQPQNQVTVPARWMTFGAGEVFFSSNTQPGAPNNGIDSIIAGAAMWTNDCESNVNYTYGGATGTTQCLNNPETPGINGVTFEESGCGDEVPGTVNAGGGTLARGGFWASFPTQSFAGENYAPITEANVVANTGLSTWGHVGEAAYMNALMAHEIGHTLGFRHSNQNQTGGACVAECTGSAIMNSSLIPYTSLQTYDQHAVRALYPGGVCCTVPTITDEPDSVSITSGNSTLLSVVATGDATLTYQWYTGNSGNTASPIAGATSSTRSVSPTSTTNYWVRVTNSCGTDDSVTVTVTVCVPATVQTHPAPATTIALGGNTNLSVVGAGTGPFTYQWYLGASGNTASPIGGATNSSLLVSPGSTTSYWVRVTNSCGSANSNTAVVTVCVPPAISTHPASQTITSGTAANLSVSTSAGSPTLTYQWYTGTSPSTTSPVGGATSSTFNPTPGATTSYWVRVTSSCNGSFVNSNTAVVTVNAIRRRWLQLGDHSGEGRSDVYWHNPVPRQNAVWFMNGAVRTNIVIPNTDVGWEPWGVGDFNGDGKDDIIHHNLNGQTAYWLLNSGTVYGRAYLPTMARPTWTIEAIGDFNNDNRDDVFWRNTSTGETIVWLMNIGGSPGMTILASRLSDLTWEPRAVGDFNGDGRDDIFFRKPTTGELAIWFMNGATATPAGAGTVGNLAWDIDGAGDFNGDGRGDIRARNFTTGDTEVWLMNGAVRTVVASSNMSLDWKARAYGDFDADGKTDVFWRHNVTGENTIWFMNGAAATPVATTTLAELVYQPATSN